MSELESSIIECNEKSSLIASLPDGSLVTVNLIPYEHATMLSSEMEATESFSGNKMRMNSSSYLRPRMNADVIKKHETNVAQSVNVSILRNSSNGNISRDDVPNSVCEDGNLPYCAVCYEYGEVICCDGCPKVYHSHCIPKLSGSTSNLDNDQDPWYCHECLEKSKRKSQNDLYSNEISVSPLLKPVATPINHGNHRAAKEFGKLTSVQSFEMKRKTFDSTTRKKRKSSIDLDADQYQPKPKRVYEMNDSGLVKIFPSFHYYLLDNRDRIERMIARRKKIADDSSNSNFDHNYLVAKEAMTLWRRLPDKERQRYILHSLDEFEQNVIEWKRDQSQYTIDYKLHDVKGQVTTKSSADDQFWKQSYNALVSGIKVRCDRSKTMPKALTALLQDNRFHPIPLVQPAREDTAYEDLDDRSHELSTFHVQGPISTGIGDECMGCTRGWHHYCPIICRTLPSVKWRAKLQPSQASLIATRIGVGLNYEQDTNNKLYGSDDSNYLTDPSKRMDSISSIIEKILAIDALENVEYFHSCIKDSKDASSDKDENLLAALSYTCRNCKSTVRSKDGCVKCKRLKLLKEEAAHGNSDVKTPTVQTAMLSRESRLAYDFSTQNMIEQTISSVMSKHTWSLNAILPRSDTDGSVLDDDSPSDSNEEFENDSTSSSSATRQSQTSITTSRRVAISSKSKYDDESFSSQHYKEQSSDLQTKCLFVAIHEILIGLLRRDPMKLFAKPVPFDVKGYHDIIENPIDFGVIKEKVFRREYKSLKAFTSDVELLCLNSRIFNPPGSIYDETAQEISAVLKNMTKRAFDWISAVKNAHASYYSCKGKLSGVDNQNERKDPFYFLRKSWYGSINLLDEHDDRLKSYSPSSFIRTKENEFAYYAAVALRRSAVAADVTVATVIDPNPILYPCLCRSADDDEALRQLVDAKVTKYASPRDLLSPSSDKEIHLQELAREIQKQRSERKVTPDSLCSRCVPKDRHDQSKNLRYADIRCSLEGNRRKRKLQLIDEMRVDESRISLSNGSASMKTSSINAPSNGISFTRLNRSVIQGLGLYAERRFKKNDIVAEYMGEYIYNPVADKREKIYEDNRIQDYQFRVSYSMVIDATKNGGFARYINHSCDPNCFTNIISGESHNEQMKRVIVIAQRDIAPGEEITYDYQFPIELDLSQRIPCGCGANNCRGFMNWDINDF